METTSKIHVWVPNLYLNAGGIQTFLRHFLMALVDKARVTEIRVLLKNDLPRGCHAENGVRYAHMFGQWPPLLRTLRFAFECFRLAWCDRPRFVVSMHLNFSPVAKIAKGFLGIPYVLVAHGIDAWNLNSRFRQKAVQKADLVLAVSRYTRDRLVQKLGLDSNRVQILPNVCSPERFTTGPKSFRLLQKYGLTAQTPIILTVCRFAAGEGYKGYDRMISALRLILREVPTTRYLLVGEGSDRARIEKLVADLGLQDNVTFTGFVPDEELAEHYNLCDLFAMPSKGEGFGIVYLEALACGKPVLAGNRDGSRDALANGELGLLVDPDDIDEIASETICVLRRQHPHPNIFHREFLRQRVTELFGFETFKRTLAERLRPFLSDDRTSPPRHKVTNKNDFVS